MHNDAVAIRGAGKTTIGASLVLLAACASSRVMAPESAIKDHGLVGKVMAAMDHGLDGRIRAYYDAQTNASDQAKIRNEIVSAFLMAIDSEYEKFTDAILFTRAGFDTAFDISAIGLGTASVLTDHMATGKLLAGLAAAATGARTVVDKNFFYEQTIPIVQAQMDSLRKSARSVLEAGMTREVAVYPLGIAVADLNEYYLAGSLTRAFAELAKSAGKDSPLVSPLTLAIEVTRKSETVATIVLVDASRATQSLPIAIQVDDGELATRLVKLDAQGRDSFELPITKAATTIRIVGGGRTIVKNVPAAAPSGGAPR